MRNTSTSKRLLKYQKAKAKLVEYDVPKSDYPDFPQNSNELSYPTIYALSSYAESVIEDNIDKQKEFEDMLGVSSQYFDAAFSSKDREQHDVDFLFSAAISYFLLDDYGSAKVICSELFRKYVNEYKTPQDILFQILNNLLLNETIDSSWYDTFPQRILNAFQAFYKIGVGEKELFSHLSTYRSIIYAKDDPMQIYYVDLLFAVVIRSITKSARVLLPEYSGIGAENWNSYLSQDNSIKMLWPSQQLIGMDGILQGANAVVQLPTGVGKTKSIELIIRSSFISGRASTAIIVAPLRALCNEITLDMQSALGDEAEINQFSDILEDDFTLDFSSQVSRVLICTPEKLKYIIHHKSGFMEQIDLFIFDEGHMFDDGSRGATYELLITEIKRSLTPEKQIILLSAVLPNAGQIKDWLIGDDGILSSDPKIKSTPKSIGFASAAKDLHYYSDNPGNEDFFVPRCIKQTTLAKFKKERKERVFPDLSSSRDVAIYFASKLCHNGGVAIYVGKANSICPTIERINELNKRSYDFGTVRSVNNEAEAKKIKNLISSYYGAEHPYSRSCDVGFFPHYSNLPSGIRLAVEYALRKKLISVVVCTSTLAQGVNVPIRYLLMTTFMVSTKNMQVRNFQNLMGRTARSGMYTEGSIIVTDPAVFDNRNTYNHGGIYRWRDQLKMFDSKASEPCGSSILSLVQDLKIDNSRSFDGKAIAQYIIENYSSGNCFDSLRNDLIQSRPDNVGATYDTTVSQAVNTYKSIINTIENYLCFGVSCYPDVEQALDPSELCKQTLAYSMADDEQKELLIRIFETIFQKVGVLSKRQAEKYSKAMIGLELANKIERWIEANQLTTKSYNESQMLEMIIGFFVENAPESKTKELIPALCCSWISGKTLLEMSEEVNTSITIVENVCSKSISYELSFLVGNIIDVISLNPEDQVDNTEVLGSIQRKLKYGVPNETGVSICEKVFNDRHLAKKLSEVIGNSDIASDSIIGYVKVFRKQILDFLAVYPSYFTERIKWICKHF